MLQKQAKPLTRRKTRRYVRPKQLETANALNRALQGSCPSIMHDRASPGKSAIATIASQHDTAILPAARYSKRAAAHAAPAASDDNEQLHSAVRSLVAQHRSLARGWREEHGPGDRADADCPGGGGPDAASDGNRADFVRGIAPGTSPESDGANYCGGAETLRRSGAAAVAASAGGARHALTRKAQPDRPPATGGGGKSRAATQQRLSAPSPSLHVLPPAEAFEEMAAGDRLEAEGGREESVTLRCCIFRSAAPPGRRSFLCRAVTALSESLRGRSASGGAAAK
jgi:hypothetical protein